MKKKELRDLLGKEALEVSGDASALSDSSEIHPTSIFIQSDPKKTTYIDGEGFDPTGMVVYAILNYRYPVDITQYVSFSPSVMTFGLRQVKIYAVFEGSQEFSTYLDVTVKARLTSISITRVPEENTYIEEERFDPTGMEVTAEYSDGSKKQVTGFLTEDSPLSAADRSVKISYSENGITKTAYQYIRAMTKKEGYFGERYLGGSCIGDEPIWVLASMGAIYDLGGISAGNNSFGLEARLLWVLQMPARLKDMCKGMPRGWKLDVHRFLVEDGYDDDGNATYKYLDGEGFVHTFVLFDAEYRRYYDSAGTGLVMRPNYDDFDYVIESACGDKLFFRDGRMVASASGRNPSIRKEYAYDNEGFLSRILDARDSSTFIELTYENEILVSMDAVYKGEIVKTLSVGYDTEGRPDLLSESIGDETCQISHMAYDSNGNLSLIYNPDTLSAVKMDYQQDDTVYRGGYRLVKVSSGFLRETEFVSHSYFAARIENVQTHDFETMNEVYFLDGNGFGTSYLLNGNAEIVGKYEGNRRGGYLTLEREEGIGLDYSAYYTSENLTSVISGTIDGRRNGMTVSGTMEFSQIRISEDDLDKAASLALSFYLYHAFVGKRLCVMVTVNGSVTEWKDVDASAYEAWQKVIIPFERPEGTIDSVGIVAYSGKNNVDVLISGVKIIKSGYTELLLNGGTKKFRDYGEIKVYQLSTSLPSLTFDNRTDIETFMTETDLAATLKRMNHNPADGGIDVFLCGGKRMYKARYGISAGDGEDFCMLSLLDNRSSLEEKRWLFRTLAADGYETRQFIAFAKDGTTIDTIASRDSLSTSSGETYDVFGNPVLSIDEYGRETKRSYSADGALLEETMLADGQEMRIYKASYDEEGFPVVCRYGNRAEGYLFDRRYGLLEAATEYDHAFGTDADTQSSRMTMFGYDVLHGFVSSVSAVDGDMALGRNTIGRNGNISDFSDGTVSYRETWSPSSRVSEISAVEEESGSLLFSSQTDGLTETDTYYGDSVYSERTESDRYGKILSKGPATFEYETDSVSGMGQRLKSINDSAIRLNTSFAYDDDGRLKKVRESRIGVERFSASIESQSHTEFRFNGTDTTAFLLEHDDDAVLSPRMKSTRNLAEGAEISVLCWGYDAYDSFGRLTEKRNRPGGLWDGKYRYGYLTQGNMTSPLISSCTYNGSVLFDDDFLVMGLGFEYDGRGNIIRVRKSSSCKSPQADGSLCHDSVTAYSYDGLDRIVSMETETEDRKTGNKSKTKYRYSYNAYGRMTKMERNGFSGILSYDGRGRLSSIRFTGSGAVFYSYGYGYDNYGNRTEKRYLGGDVIERYVWERGRFLSEIRNGDDETKARYTYDASGIRKSKTASGVTTQFYYLGTTLMGEDRSDGTKLRFFYDAEGPCGFRCFDGTEWKTYTYVRDIFGDIVMIKDEMGAPRVLYRYDPFGNATVTCLNLAGRQDNSEEERIAKLSPFRYRGYHYDEESGLYYLITRYYDSWTGKFISPDPFSFLDPETVGGIDLYCYCLDNPIMNVDPLGQDWEIQNWLKWAIGATVITGLGIATVFTGDVAGVILGAAFYGALTGAVSGAIVSGLIGGIISANSGDGFWKGMADGSSDGFMLGAISGAALAALTSGANIAFGGVKIVGTAQKTSSVFHQFARNVQAGKMSLAIGKYSEIHLNRSKGLGIKGFRPDVTGVGKNGLSVVEVVSKSQTYKSQVDKIELMKKIYPYILKGVTIDLLHLILKWFWF